MDFRLICCSECEGVWKSRRPLDTLLAAKGFGCTCVFGVVAVLQRRRYVESLIFFSVYHFGERWQQGQKQSRRQPAPE